MPPIILNGSIFSCVKFFQRINFLKFEQIFFMKKIQMVDLQSQYYKIKSEVDNAVLNVMDSAAFINGPEVKSFQNELEITLM